MNYAVKEIYYTLQGEGINVGRPSVFLRFAGCNLWSGREVDRTTAVCQFCDTDFVGTDGPGGGKFATANDLADAVEAAWPLGWTSPCERCAAMSIGCDSWATRSTRTPASPGATDWEWAAPLCRR